MLSGIVSSVGVGGTVEVSEINSDFVYFDDTNDRLGIGIATPDGNLHIMKASAGSVTVVGQQANGIIVEDDDSTAITLLDPAGGVIYFGDADDTDIGRIGYRHGGDYSNSMYFTTNNSQRMTIDSTGNVGIGTPTPDTKLEVNGSFAANGASSTFVTFADGDATPSVAGGNIFKHHASVQTIDMFDDGICGQIITVISTAAITYDFDASNLKCGAANIVTADGDVTMWVFDGTNWYLLSWMDVSANLADGSAGGF